MRRGEEELERDARLQQEMGLILADPRAVSALRCLYHQGGMVEAELARALSLDVQSVREVLERLQRCHLVVAVKARDQLRLGIGRPELSFRLSVEAENSAVREALEEK